MTEYKWCALLFRGFGIYAFLHAVESAPFIVAQIINPQATMESSERLMVVTYVFFVVLFLIVGVSLFVLAKRFANYLATDDEEHEDLNILSVDEIESVVFSGIGLFYTIQSLTRILRVIIASISTVKVGSSISEDFYTSMAMFGFGILLLLKAKGFVGVLKRLRQIGTTKRG